MVISQVYTTESINGCKITDYDMLILEHLVSIYGSDIVFDSINESHSYYGSGGSFDNTGGSRVTGMRGLLQSLPSLAMTAVVAWPLVLLQGLGAISHRITKKFEDKNSWLNRLDPRFWTEYLGTYRGGGSSSSGWGSPKSSSSGKKGGWMSRVKNALFGAGAGAAGGLAAAAVLSKSKDSSTNDSSSGISSDKARAIAMNAIFVPYWVTLSNGEVLRLRSDSAENAKTMANMIIAYTKKPCYDKLNLLIKEGCPRYKFTFDDGEVCYWSGQSQKKAYDEALKTRKELCAVMNTMTPEKAVLDDLSVPKIVGDVEVVRDKQIPVPQQGKFLNVTTNKPEFKTETALKLPNPVYAYKGLSDYVVNFANFTFNIPAYTDSEAKDITKAINSDFGHDIIRDVYVLMNKTYPMYKVYMPDGDIYAIPSKDGADIERIALNLYNAKVSAIRSVLQDAALEDYNDFMKKFSGMINFVKRVELIDNTKGKDYTIRKGDVATIIKKSVEKNEKSEKFPSFEL